MTPNQIITKAKKRVRTNTANLDWPGFYEDVIDEIFSKKPWRFARKEINYIHPQQTFEKTFNADSTELSLNHIISAYYTLSFASGGLGPPVAQTGTSRELEYIPYIELNKYHPDHMIDGYPDYITIIRDSDNVSGMQIGIYRRPVSDAAIWVYGDFIPSYVINDNPMPILPKQFHRIVVYGVVAYAAEENGQDQLSNKAYAKFSKGLAELDDWDRTNPIYKPAFQPYDRDVIRKGPRFPYNYPA